MKYHDKPELHFFTYIPSRHCNRVSIGSVYVLPFFPFTLYLTDNTRDGQNIQLIAAFCSKRRRWYLISEARLRKEEEKNGLL